MEPVSLSPSSFSLSVISRSWLLILTVHFQVPVGFALSSARRAPTDPAKVTTNAAAKSRFMRCLLRKIGVCLRQHLLRGLLIRPLEVDAIAEETVAREGAIGRGCEGLAGAKRKGGSAPFRENDQAASRCPILRGR